MKSTLASVFCLIILAASVAHGKDVLDLPDHCLPDGYRAMVNERDGLEAKIAKYREDHNGEELSGEERSIIDDRMASLNSELKPLTEIIDLDCK